MKHEKINGMFVPTSIFACTVTVGDANSVGIPRLLWSLHAPSPQSHLDLATLHMRFQMVKTMLHFGNFRKVYEGHSELVGSLGFNSVGDV